MASKGVVVWEWQNEFGCWRPYDPTISTFIESNKTSANPLKLGHVDPSLYLYEIDLHKMCQTRLGTGTQRLIRRQVQPPTSPLAKGITWQWEGDIPGRWNEFDVDVIEILESCFSQGQTFIDLSVAPMCLPYHIDLSKMTQTRVHTGRVRKIQRVFTSSSYPLDLSTSTRTSSNSKRTMASSNNVLMKKPRTLSPSMNTASTVTSASSFSSLNLAVPPSTSAPFGQQSSFMHQSASANTTSVPSSVIQFGQGQGPLTRSRYNSGLAAMMMQNPPYQVFQPSQAVPPSVVSNNNNYLPNLNLSGPGQSFLNTSFSNTSGYMHGLFPNQTSVPSQGGFGGVTHQHVSNSFVGFTPSSTAATLQQNLNYPQSGGLNPSGVCGGSKSGRVRPSASSRSSKNSPQNHGRIQNFEKSTKQRSANVNSSSDIIDSYAVLLNTSPADEDCCICCEKLQESSGHGTGTLEDHAVIQLEKCSHMFHKLCLTAMYDSGPQEGSLQCPTCKTIYGEKRGNCPAGEMEYHVISAVLPGYEGHKTIQISYHIPSGTQGPEHPHPGKRYSTRGFPRIGYVPDCDKGRKVLQLLIVAWKRRLTFTIGTSATTGEDDTVIWNEIHHKTELGTNYSGHGYPDPKYLDNVLLELAVHGITDKDLPP